MNVKLDKIKAKIAAMMNLAKDKAATEAEAEVALRKAMQMMKEHSLSLDDIATGNVSKSDFTRTTVDKDRVQVHVIDRMCAVSIARFCDCRTWIDRKNGGISFFGYSVDVELACYIRDLVIRTSEYEWSRYSNGLKGRVFYDKDGKVVHKKTIRTSFLLAFGERIRERLNAMKDEILAEGNKEQSTALVVVKMQLVSAALEDAGVKTIKSSTKTRTVYATPANAGRDAADKVKFNRAVGDGPQGSQRMIGELIND